MNRLGDVLADIASEKNVDLDDPGQRESLVNQFHRVRESLWFNEVFRQLYAERTVCVKAECFPYLCGAAGCGCGERTHWLGVALPEDATAVQGAKWRQMRLPILSESSEVGRDGGLLELDRGFALREELGVGFAGPLRVDVSTADAGRRVELDYEASGGSRQAEVLCPGIDGAWTEFDAVSVHSLRTLEAFQDVVVLRRSDGKAVARIHPRQHCAEYRRAMVFLPGVCCDEQDHEIELRYTARLIKACLDGDLIEPLPLAGWMAAWDVYAFGRKASVTAGEQRALVSPGGALDRLNAALEGLMDASSARSRTVRVNTRRPYMEVFRF